MEKLGIIKDEKDKSLNIRSKKIKLYNLCKVMNTISLICLVLDLLYICFKQKEELDFILSLIKEKADSFYIAETIANIPNVIALGLILIFAFTGVLIILLRRNLIVRYTIK